MLDKKLLDKIDKGALFELCLEYDMDQGEYPESSYEGRSVFEFLIYQLGEHLDQLGYNTYEGRAKIYKKLLEERKIVTKDT